MKNNTYFILLLCSLIFISTHAQKSNIDAGRDVALYSQSGDSLFELGDYSRAIIEYQNAEIDANVHFKIAKSYEALGFSKEAITHFKMALEKDASNVLIQYNYGKLLYSLGNIKQANPVFAALAENNAENPNYPYYQGLLAEKENDTLAIPFYLSALKDDPNHLNTVYRLAKILTEKRKFNQAKLYITQGLKADEKSSKFLILKALSAFYQDEFHDAITSFNKLIELGEGTEQFLEKLAISYAKTYQYQLAVNTFEKLIKEYDPKNASYFYNLGKCLMGIEQYEKGRLNIEMAIALRTPSLDSEYVSIAASYNREKNYKKTIEYLNKAIKENPFNQYAQYQLAIAADNYYEDDSEVLKLYEQYILNFDKEGDFYQLAFTRANDLKQKIHLSKE
ncbi:hypothetical protein ULMS_00310 [Patiriisocius marinistellae]|uniref:Uncharacterized protein n=1 Tax=Patiriisocius marinistellae TaxID=2494560 RepID=A0A5J4FSY3_9FLAO|nr:tetratricopeptide repeat protein [Patiriisocius marinistellae]GEQ84523.1 hypothetical protein ULMS_00310 [Patiriisocius marinistellae]